MEDWKELFEPAILKRGLDLFKYGSVGEIEEDKNNFSTTVEGTNGYFTSLTLVNGSVKNPKCTCAYSQNATYCKHLAAMLYKMEAEYGKAVFLEDNNPDKQILRKAVKKIKTNVPFYWQKLTFEDDDKPHYLSFGNSLDIYKPTGETYLEAEDLIINDRLGQRKIEIDMFNKERCLIYNNIVFTEDGKAAEVKIILRKNGIESITCRERQLYYYKELRVLTRKCAHTAKNKDGVIELCVHKTAALLDLFQYLKENRDIIDYSDTSAETLISSFKKEKKIKAEEMISGLFPVDIDGEINGKSLYLKITNEEGKYYKVRDITKLYYAYEEKGTYTQGNNCTIDFSRVSLTPRAEKFMELLKENEINYLLEHQNDYYYHREKNELPYTEILDEFYSLMADTSLLHGSSRLIGFREKEPSFNMKIEELIDRGKLVGIKAEGSITGKYKSRKYLYWFQDGYLNRTLLSSLGSASALSEIAKDDGTFSFTVGMNLIENFYQRVLPDLRRYGRIEDNAVDSIETVIDEVPVSVFYVDFAENDEWEKVIVCRPALRYENKEVDILPEERGWKSFLQDKNPKWNAFESDVRESLGEIFNGPTTMHGEWSLKNDDDSLFDFLHSGLGILMSMGEVHVTDEVKRIVLKKMPRVKGSIDIDEKDDSILNFTLDLQGLTIDELADILKSYRDNKRYHRLKNGDFITLGGVNLDSLYNLFMNSGLSIKDFIKGKTHIPLYRALYLEQILSEQNGITYEGGQKFRRLIKEFKTINESDYEVPSSLESVMRSYQKDGYRWMRVLFDHGFGGILADDMGLGKTLQALSLLEALKNEGKKANTIIISPASLVFNWKAEASKFTPSLKAVTVTGNAKEREEIIKNHLDYDLLITSYDLLKRDVEFYEGVQFDIEIIDEAQFIKNSKTTAAKSVRAVQSTHRLALTGTPIENRLSELWSIFEYLMPGFLYSQEAFTRLFATPIEKSADKGAAERLKKLTGPFILRRLKTDVLKDLPEKIEETRVTPLEGEQLRLYTAEVAKAQGMLKDSENYNQNKIEILAELMRIREICCDPSLVFKGYAGESAKREAVMDLIVSAIDGGHKILLFSQFTSMLALLEKDLEREGIEYYKITGETGKAKRLELVDAFNSGTVPLFLISLKAGGTGLNLTAADIVIHYDPWWNTAVQNQATDRAHRIGQTKRVTVYRMIAENTIEEKIMKLQETKKNLADEIVSSDNITLSNLTQEDLMDLLEISEMR